MKVRLGIVLAVVVAGCGTTVPPVPPVNPATSGAPSMGVVVETPEPTTSEPQPARTVCLRTPDENCAQAIELVRQGHASAVDSARTIIVADTCPPRSVCDRLYVIDTVVVLVPGGTGGQTAAFHVVGQDRPEQVTEWIGDPFPEDVLEALQTA